MILIYYNYDKLFNFFSPNVVLIKVKILKFLNKCFLYENRCRFYTYNIGYSYFNDII